MYGTSAPGPQTTISPSSGGQYISQAIQPAPVAAPTTSTPKPKAPAKHKSKKPKAGGVPGINQYLAGDTTYQDQWSQLRKQLEQFRTSNRSQQGMVNQDFQTALDKMMKQKTADMSNMTSDYGARGLLNSGLFVKSQGDYNNNFLTQQNDLNTSKQRSLSDLLESLANYQTENSSALTSAKQDAIRRRAQKYGITTG